MTRQEILEKLGRMQAKLGRMVDSPDIADLMAVDEKWWREYFRLQKQENLLRVWAPLIDIAEDWERNEGEESG